MSLKDLKFLLNKDFRESVLEESKKALEGYQDGAVCPRCKSDTRPASEVCLSCGLALKDNCPECGVKKPVAAFQCPQCHHVFEVDLEKFK